jgi:DNA-binding PadR family transcriptional regulator
MSYEETKRALRVSPEVQNDYQMYAFLDRKVDEGYILGAGLDEDGDVIFALTPKGRTLE